MLISISEIAKTIQLSKCAIRTRLRNAGVRKIQKPGDSRVWLFDFDEAKKAFEDFKPKKKKKFILEHYRNWMCERYDVCLEIANQIPEQREKWPGMDCRECEKNRFRGMTEED